MAHQWRGVIREYFDRLPFTQDDPIVTLGEGGTPLIEAPALAKLLDVGSVHLKFEGMNPTGSFKDRGMTMAVSKAVGHGAQAVIAASTGNTSASGELNFGKTSKLNLEIAQNVITTIIYK